MRIRSRLTVEMGIDAKERKAKLFSLGIDEGTREALRALYGIIEPSLPELVDRWFVRQQADPSTRELVIYAKSRGHLGPGLMRHLRTIMEGRYGDAYFETRLRVGLIHEHVGVEPSWYMGAWRTVADLIRRILEERGVPHADRLKMLAAMERVVQLDQVLALDAYFHAKNRVLVRTNEELGRLAEELEEKNVKLAAQYEKAQEASRIKEEFLSRVSHELRTPLNAIIGYSDILLDGIDGPLNGEQTQSVAKMRRSGEVLLGLIDGMISASRMAASGIVSSASFDVFSAVAGVLDRPRMGAEEKGLEFILEPPEQPLREVVGDEEAFTSAVGQVLDNAVKFTDSGSVRVSYLEAAGGVRVCVSDTGPGVPPEEREKIFEAFHQVDGGDDRSHEGLGMGLTLAARAMRAMGGSLDISQAKEGGAMFCLWLPYARQGDSGN